MCSSMRPSTICKLDTVPEQLFHSSHPAAMPASSTRYSPRDTVDYSNHVPVLPRSAHLNVRPHTAYPSTSMTSHSPTYLCSPPLPPIPLVINISKETCYDYDYDTHVYTPSVEQHPSDAPSEGRTSPSSEARGTYYASSWTGSIESLTNGTSFRETVQPIDWLIKIFVLRHTERQRNYVR